MLILSADDRDIGDPNAICFESLERGKFGAISGEYLISASGCAMPMVVEESFFCKCPNKQIVGDVRVKMCEEYIKHICYWRYGEHVHHTALNIYYSSYYGIDFFDNLQDEGSYSIANFPHQVGESNDEIIVVDSIYCTLDEFLQSTIYEKITQNTIYPSSVQAMLSDLNKQMHDWNTDIQPFEKILFVDARDL